MAQNRINFNKSELDNLELPAAGQRATYHDTKVEGLQIRVTSSGTKTFSVFRWVKGAAKPERVTLGRYPDLPIEEARTMARKINAVIATGENPADKKRAARAEMTFGELFAEYMERHAKEHKKTWHEDEKRFNSYLTSWSKKKLSTIKPIDVLDLHKKVGKAHGKVAANRLVTLLGTVFNKAREWRIWEKENPAVGIKKFKEQSRDRFLQADELPRFFEALAQEENETMRDYFLVSLLTGARRSNVQAMRWDDINLERGEWRIPETKNGTPQTVPLIPAALQILQTRHDHKQGEFVFPGRGKTGHLVEPVTGWKRLLKRAGLKNLRIHDLRRTLGSWQAATGASLAVIGKTLNHKSVNATAIYARLNIDPVRQAMETATSAMLTHGGLLPVADVVDLKKATGQN